MSSSPWGGAGWIVALLAVLMAACGSSPCQRHSDCGGGRMCTLSGRCEFPPDASLTDAQPTDASEGDSQGPSDAARRDAAPADSGDEDASTSDGAAIDARDDGGSDASTDTPDTGVPDGISIDGGKGILDAGT